MRLYVTGATSAGEAAFKMYSMQKKKNNLKVSFSRAIGKSRLHKAPREPPAFPARLGNRGYIKPYVAGVTSVLLFAIRAAIYNDVRERYDLLPSQKIKIFI